MNDFETHKSSRLEVMDDDDDMDNVNLDIHFDLVDAGKEYL